MPMSSGRITLFAINVLLHVKLTHSQVAPAAAEKPETIDQIVEELNKPVDHLASETEKFSGMALMRIKFVRYINIDKRRGNGHYCDPIANGAFAESACDPLFRAELVMDGGKTEKILSSTEHYTNVDGTLDFNNKVGASDNPIDKIIDMRISGNMFLEVKVDDYDDFKSHNDPIDIFVEKLEREVRAYKEVELKNPGSTHSLVLQYFFRCTDHYFGILCTIRCVPQDNDTYGHYECSPEGEKVCRQGWANVDHDCKTPAWCMWC